VFPVLVVFLVCSAWAVSTARAFIRVLSGPTDFGRVVPEIGRFLHTECISTATLVTVAFSAETVVEARAPGARLSRRVISFSWPDFQTFSHSLDEDGEDLIRSVAVLPDRGFTAVRTGPRVSDPLALKPVKPSLKRMN
jgi:hypothetical protein